MASDPTIIALFEDTEAQRKNVPISVGVQGPPGGGKTFTSLVMAQGAQDVRGGDIFLIDTEGRRALKYAGYDPQIPGVRPFKFRHVDFQGPFKPSNFMRAFQHCEKQNPAAIICDSASDEHEGIPWGVRDWKQRNVETKKYGANEWAAWKDPKEDRKQLT